MTPLQMSERANVYAEATNLHQKFAPADTTHIYDDGYVVTKGHDISLSLAEFFPGHQIERGRSSDGDVWAWVIPCTPSDKHAELPLLTQYVNDHRQDDHCQIDDAIDLFRKVLARRKALEAGESCR